MPLIPSHLKRDWRLSRPAIVPSIAAPNGIIEKLNDRVDVLLTVIPTLTETKTQTATQTTIRTSMEGQTVASSTILRNVRVLAIDLAIDQNVDERSKDGTFEFLAGVVGPDALGELCFGTEHGPPFEI